MFALLAQEAAETEGIWSGEGEFADVMFIIAIILCGIGAVIAYSAKALWATLVAAGLCFGFIGLAVWS